MILFLKKDGVSAADGM